jgi:hypothetical protein
MSLLNTLELFSRFPKVGLQKKKPGAGPGLFRIVWFNSWR